MSDFTKLDYTYNYQDLPNALYTLVKPRGISNPRLVATSESCAELIGIDTQSLSSNDSLKIISGQALLSNWHPLAMKYAGHQFGYYNPDLGDGRGLLLAQIKKASGTILDLHLKGAGMTPYSRQGDGRAVLRSSIREFLCSEALHGLGVPTSRALCVIDSDTTVYRETPETASMIVRVSQSHIRFGHFEFCSFTKQHDLLRTLCDSVIEQHYPEFNQTTDTVHNKYEKFYEATLKRTAKLMAHWQSIGFCHGVMNTDNMSIIGDTFDFGPFAFLDDYNPHFICNHSDHQGRYAFNQQPSIANWNLSVLAQALLPLANKDILLASLDRYNDLFSEYYLEILSKKLGLSEETPKEKNQKIIEKTLSMMAKCHLDYTFFFRKLSRIEDGQVKTKLRNMALDVNSFDQWYLEYTNTIELQGLNLTDTLRCEKMDAINPKYILRNYLAQNAINAAQEGDYSVTQTLHNVLKHPFNEQPEHEELAQLPPDWGKKLEISCSS
jgi:uncharacterized protein YdiU (UPF0061 family)